LAAVGFVYDDIYLQHRTGGGHPERPERLDAIMAHLRRQDVLSDLVNIESHPADLAAIQAVHPGDYIHKIQNACKRGFHYLDSDTVVCEDSFDAGLQAVGGVLAACDAVMQESVTTAFCALRPPGHHAEPNRAMGFCMFNNVAVAARYAQSQYGLKKSCYL